MNRTRLVLVLLLVASLAAAQSTAGGAAEVEQLQVKREGADVMIQVILRSTVKPSIWRSIPTASDYSTAVPMRRGNVFQCLGDLVGVSRDSPRESN